MSKYLLARLTRPLLLLCLALSALPAAAQVDFMVTFNSNVNSAIGLAGTTAVNSAIDTSARNAAAKRSLSSRLVAGTFGAANQPASASTLAYDPSQSVAAEVKREFVAGLSQASPEHAAQIEQQLARTDLVAEFDREMQPYGLRSGNLGDAFAAYWAAMWAVANAQPFPDKERIAVIRSQLAPALLNNPTVANADDATRQRLAEGMIHEAAFALAAHDNAMKGNAPFTAQQLADYADGNLKKKGMDFRAMELTDAGFVRR